VPNRLSIGSSAHIRGHLKMTGVCSHCLKKASPFTYLTVFNNGVSMLSSTPTPSDTRLCRHLPSTLIPACQQVNIVMFWSCLPMNIPQVFLEPFAPAVCRGVPAPMACTIDPAMISICFFAAMSFLEIISVLRYFRIADARPSAPETPSISAN
jgi:hypothetical protein